MNEIERRMIMTNGKRYELPASEIQSQIQDTMPHERLVISTIVLLIL
jgi:hypothetical protein